MKEDTRIGQGYDIHRTAEGRSLVLGGVSIPIGPGLDGHSDADVLLHALIDGLLGAAGQGDIGTHFPDTDPRFKGADSANLAGQALDIIAKKGYRVINADLTIVTEKPRLGPYKSRIRGRIAEILKVEIERVNLKAKTKEGLGPVGRGEAMEAHAVVLIAR